MPLAEIGAIGNREAILCLQAVGVTIFPSKSRHEAQKAFRFMVKNRYAIILVTEPIAELIKDEIEATQAETLPAVVVIPDNTGSKGVGVQHIEDAVIKAVGANIFSESEE